MAEGIIEDGVINEEESQVLADPQKLEQALSEIEDLRWKLEGITIPEVSSSMAKYASGTVTITGGGGDVTVDVPFDWTGGYLIVHRSDTLVNYYESTAYQYRKFETSYIALTDGTYTKYQIMGEAGTESAYFTKGSTSGTQKTGNPKSATATSFTLTDDLLTSYIKWFIIA